jgi:hypothetical protein
MNLNMANAGNNQLPNMPKQMIDLKSATDLKCNECENLTFMPVMKFKRISALVSPTGKEAIVPFECYVCTACGNIPAELDIPIQ